jgi:hypothetical protein
MMASSHRHPFNSGALSRSETLRLLPVGLPSFYQKKIITVHHPGVGGVRSTTWRFVVYWQWIDVMPTTSIMTGQALRRTLQTALSDVVGAPGECNCEYREGVQPSEAIGTVTSSGGRDSSPLFSGYTLGPDLHVLPFKEVHFWVRAECVYSKTPVIRWVKTAKLFAIWDYKGKLESQQWSYIQQLGILRACLACPPAKMLRRFTQFICDASFTRLSKQSHYLEVESSFSAPMVGLTCDVPFSYMEIKASTGVGAAQANDAEVDLSAWALLDKMDEQVCARNVLWRFAIRWWARNIAVEAMSWWRANRKDPKDSAAIQNCIFRARACSYWHWTRGSRLFFWRLPKEFHEDMRGGIPFYHLSPPPRGHAQNYAVPV